MAFSKQSVASTRTLRSSGVSTKENVESPGLFTRTKKLRSSGNVSEAPKQSCGVSDSTSTRQSRKSRRNCDGESRDSSLLRQPLSGIQNFAFSTSFMTRGRKSRTEQRLAKALNWNPGDFKNLPVPSQESRLGSDWRNKKNGDIGGISGQQRDSVLPRDEAHLSRSQSSQTSCGPSGILRTDDDDVAVLSEDNHVHISYPHSSDMFRTSAEVSLSPDEIDACALAVHQEKDYVQNSSSRSCQTLSPQAPSSSEHKDISVTPARRASSRLATGALQTPEHLMSALGEGSPRNGEAGTDGKLRVYERRTSQQFEKKSSRAKTCPQLRGTSTNTASMRRKGTGHSSEHYSLRNLKDLFASQRKVGSGPKKTSISASQSNNMLLPESYRQEKCAYFAEVDAFELLEEEADEEDDLEDTKKQKDAVE